MANTVNSEELAVTYAALILADSGHNITTDTILAITNAASIQVTSKFAELLAKALQRVNVHNVLLGYTPSETRFFASLPEELITQIVAYAGEVVPDELAIRHPADGLDPLFTNGKLAPKNTWEGKWEEALATRLSMMKVCRKFRRITTPILYSSYFTTDGPDLQRFLATIQRRPHLGQHIRRIDIFFCRHQFEHTSATCIPELVQLCPNLQILSTPTPLDPNILPTSLKSLQIKYFSNHQYEMDLTELLHRLKHLERLSLRVNLSLQEGPIPSLAMTHHPSLRTVCLEGRMPDTVIESIISSSTSIQSVRFRNVSQQPAMIFSRILPRAKHLTHLSFPLSWTDSIPPDVSIPSLRHIHIEATLSIGVPTMDRLYRLGPIRSMGHTLKGGTLHWTMERLQSLVADLKSHRIPTRLMHIYTDRKSLQRQVLYRDDPSWVREWVMQEKLGMGSGVEWLVQSGTEVVPIQNLVSEVESDMGVRKYFKKIGRYSPIVDDAYEVSDGEACDGSFAF